MTMTAFPGSPLLRLAPAGVLILVSLCCSTTRGPQVTREAATYYYNGDAKIPVQIAERQIGVVLKNGSGSRDALLTAGGIALKFSRTYQNKIDVFDVTQTADAVTDRKALARLARSLFRENTARVRAAGLLVTPAGAESPAILGDQFIALFTPGTSRQQIDVLNSQNGVEIVRPDPFVRQQYLLRVTDASPIDALDMANRYRESGLTIFAEPNFTRESIVNQASPFIPNDPLFQNQWPHDNTGQSGGTLDADVDTPLAWSLTQGSPSVVIAVIDMGTELTHPDLAPNLWTNTAGEHGYDFVDDDADPSAPSSEHHGTATAGVAAARGNNMLGVTGACPACQLMLIRAVDVAVSSDDNYQRAINYAWMNGASVISNSWALPYGHAVPTALKNAIQSAATNGRGGLGSIVVFGMSNNAFNDCTGGKFGTPSISADANVIAVSASTNTDRKTTESGIGNCMGVMAPSSRGWGPNRNGTAPGSGVPFSGTLNIPTTDRIGTAGFNNTDPFNAMSLYDPTYCPGESTNLDYTLCFGGTSAATPLVAGIAALVLSANPGLTRIQVQRLLQDTTDRIEDSLGAYSSSFGFSTPSSGTATHGWGRINAFEAVRIAAPAGQSGRAGTDLYLRDNRLDWGNTEQPSNILFEPTRGFIPHFTSVDIKVDAPPYQSPAPTTPEAFEAFVHENPKTGMLNRVYVRVHNRGPVTAGTVTVKLQWADAGTGLPALPSDYWSTFPASSSSGAWHGLPCAGSPTSTSCSISNLAYSGPSVAGCSGSTPRPVPDCFGGTDAAQIVAFDFNGPAIGPSGVNHFCLFAVIDSDSDRAGPLTRTPTMNDFIPDILTPLDNNVTHRNVVVDPGTGSPLQELFWVRNPFRKPMRTVLHVKAPAGWRTAFEGVAVERPLTMKPGEEILAKLTIVSPAGAARGVVSVTQEYLDATMPGSGRAPNSPTGLNIAGEAQRHVFGGIEFDVRP